MGDGEHCPYLTVSETFEFAAECTGDDVTNRVTYVMDMLGLRGVKDTVIGDENLKGISGGQKKRVLIGEILIDSNTGEMNYFGLVNQIQNMYPPTSSYASIQYYQSLQHIHPPPSNKNKSYLCQFMIIAKRRWKLIIRNPVSYGRPIASILYGLLIGSLYSELHSDTLGMIGREGYIYLICYISLFLSTTLTLPVVF